MKRWRPRKTNSLITRGNSMISWNMESEVIQHYFKKKKEAAAAADRPMQHGMQGRISVAFKKKKW